MHANNGTCLQSNDTFFFCIFTQRKILINSAVCFCCFTLVPNGKISAYLLLLFHFSFAIVCHSYLFMFVIHPVRTDMLPFLCHGICSHHMALFCALIVWWNKMSGQFSFSFSFLFSCVWKLVNGAYKFSTNCVSKYNDNQKLHLQCNHRVIIEAEEEIMTMKRWRRAKHSEWNWKLEQWLGSSQTRSDNESMEVVTRYGKKLKSASLTVTMSFAAPNYEEVCECII